MTIASEIGALSPNLWWKLDEGAGNTAHNSGSLTNDGTGSGSLDWTVRGPEPGTTAVRFASGGQIVSAAMDVSTIRNMTILFWYSAAGNGTTGVNRPILSLGDVNNRLTRGPVVWETHSSIGNPQLTARWNQATAPTATLPTYPMNWHMFCVVFDQTNNLLRIYLDQTVVTPINMNGNVAALLTDPLLLRADTSITFSNVAVWMSVIGQTQIQTIASQAQGYGFEPPINTISGGDGGGGGLTPEQDTTLTEIDTKTDDIPGIVDAVTYISSEVNVIHGFVEETNSIIKEVQDDVQIIKDLVTAISNSVGPALGTKVDNILDNIQKNFITAEGIVLSSAVGGLLAHPDPAFLHETDDEFTISGRGTFTPPGPLSFANVYGLRWTATTVPPSVGVRDGVVPEFIHRLVQIALWYPDPTTLDLDVWEVHDSRFLEYTYLWPRYHPWMIRYDVCPGFVLTCHWILWSPVAP